MGGVALVAWAWRPPSTRPLQEATAAAVVRVADLIGLAASRVGTVVRFDAGDRFQYVVGGECTGLTLFCVFAVAASAFPVSRRQRLTGIALGAAVLFLLNLVRLVMLGWIGVYRPRAFDAVHLYWWQVFSVFAVAGLWVWWAAYATSERSFARPKAGTAFAAVALATTVATPVADWYAATLRLAAAPFADAVAGGRTLVALAAELALGAPLTNHYPLLAGTVAIVVSLPGTGRRKLAAAALAVPLTYALHVVSILAGLIALRYGASEPIHTLISLLTLVGHLGIVGLAWSWCRPSVATTDSKEGHREDSSDPRHRRAVPVRRHVHSGDDDGIRR